MRLGRRSGRILLLSALALLPGCATDTVERTAAKIQETAIRDSHAYETLAHLTDRIGQRLSGSKGLQDAVLWTEAEMTRYGLDRVWTEKVMVPHWVRGTENASLLLPTAQPMAVVALGGSEPTPQGGIEAEVLEVDSFEALKAAGEKARGKIILYYRKMSRSFRGESGYGAGARLRTRGAVEAAKAGAVATLIRSLGTASYRLPHTGAMSYDPNQPDLPRLPSGALAAEDADLIHRLLEAGETVRVRLELGCRILPDAESANVLADIRGSVKPEEIVLIGGHLDSWDLGTGAIDDGAGIAIVMESMRILKSMGIAPRRTIRAVLFTNEENGLRGGRGYEEAHRLEGPNHVAAIESDSGGAHPLGFGVTAGPGGVERVRGWAAGFAPSGATAVRNGGGGADIGPLEAHRVPMLSLNQEGTYYFDYHHTAADTLDKVTAEDLAKNTAALAAMAYRLSEAEPILPRPPAPKPGEYRRRG